MTYYIVLKAGLYCGILGSHDKEPLTDKDNVVIRIKLTDDDAQKYLDAEKNKKQIYIDKDGIPQIRNRLKK